MKIDIILARPEDADALTQITISAKRYWNYPERWIQAWIPLMTITAEYILSHETCVVLFNGSFAGYYSLTENPEGLWLDNLWVLPEYMGRGIGKLLFEHALERCKARNIIVLKIEADPNAQSFYERMGARKIDEHKTQVVGEQRILPIMEMKI